MRNPRERIRNSRGYKWWILSLVMLGTFMAVMDVTVVNVGLPTIMSVFHIPISTAEWVITAYNDYHDAHAAFGGLDCRPHR